jgi:hypothetical protein
VGDLDPSFPEIVADPVIAGVWDSASEEPRRGQEAGLRPEIDNISHCMKSIYAWLRAHDHNNISVGDVAAALCSQISNDPIHPIGPSRRETLHWSITEAGGFTRWCDFGVAAFLPELPFHPLELIMQCSIFMSCMGEVFALPAQFFMEIVNVPLKTPKPSAEPRQLDRERQRLRMIVPELSDQRRQVGEVVGIDQKRNRPLHSSNKHHEICHTHKRADRVRRRKKRWIVAESATRPREAVARHQKVLAVVDKFDR